MIIRVRFGKEGALRFIGHLDVLRTFQKIFRRAEIPMVYSQGYSPHPIMSFALPLGLGLSSEGEYLDAEIEEMAVQSPPPASLCEAPSPASGGGQAVVDEVAFPFGEGGSPTQSVVDEVLKRLRAATSPELPVYAVRVLSEKAGNAMASVGRARYRLTFREDLAKPLAAAADRLLAEKQHIIEKKTKTQTVSFDLRPCLYEVTVIRAEGSGEEPHPPASQDDPLFAPHCLRIAQAPPPAFPGGGEAVLLLVLSAGSKANVKPELVWEELLKTAGLPAEEKPLAIRRLDLMTEDGSSLGEV